ncbi:MAG: MFS transporter [Dehalococcoidales bacterium]|nr:MFS transporter [Dehalococcoidales bacterium]
MDKEYGQSRKNGIQLNLSFPWVVVLLGALLLMVGNINPNVFGVFFKPVAEEFGWSRAEVSGAYAIRSLVMAVMSIPMGYWSDRYGPRKVILPCFVLLGIGFLLNAMVGSLWQFYLVQGLLIGVASSGPFVSIISAVAKWHDKRRGLALGVASTGIGLSGVIFPPLAANLILAVGWRGAMALLGIAVFVVALPSSLFMKDPPSKSNGSASQRGGPLEVWRMLPRFLANRTFVAIVLMFLFFYIACNVIISHLVNYVTDAGVSTIIAATMMSVMGIAGTMGRLIMGTFSDKIGTRNDALICYVLLAVSLVLLNLGIPALIWVSVVLFGVAFGGASPLMPAIMGEHFGTEHLATLTGATVVGACLGATIGPMLGGFIFDEMHSYRLALAIAAALAIVPICIALRLSPPAKANRDNEKVLFE